MNLREKLAVINNINRHVQADRMPVLCCYQCDAVMLHYVEGDDVVLKCTSCPHTQTPGWLWYSAMQALIDRADEDATD